MRYTDDHLIADLKRLDASTLSAFERLALESTLASLKFLHQLAAERGKAIEEITGADVIGEFERGAHRSKKVQDAENEVRHLSLGANAVRLGAANSSDTETVREVPRAKVCILWVNVVEEVPLEGMAEVGGSHHFFEIIASDSPKTKDESHRYWLIALSDEQLREEERWHDLFCRKVGTHYDYTGQIGPLPGQECPDEFYGPFRRRAQPDYADNEVVGWFRL